MTLRLFDTYSRSIREFKPLSPPNVGLYTCGPTVYDYAHIGNLRTYLFEDLLRRVLEFYDYQVQHVMNITDVGHLVSDADSGEDKMEKGSRRTGRNAWEIAEIYTNAFKDDLKQLNILEPSTWCKATDHIPEQIDFIQKIEAKGYTYQTTDGIYFDTSKLKDYGYLARLDIDGLQAGTRVEFAEKRNVTDFALWKFSDPDKKRQMEWDSPWGRGFPGWHIECSAMSNKYLGAFFDIHCGGEDHIPVHHTNEIAQNQACLETNLANFWMHGYFLNMKEGKMSKSDGEFLRLKSLLDRGYDVMAYRFFCLSAHYRSKLNFSWDNLDSSARALDRLRKNYYQWEPASTPDEEYMKRFTEHIGNDLDMPQVLALIWELVKSDIPLSIKKATLNQFDCVLGLDLAAWEPPQEVIPEEILALAKQRQEARQNKNWQEADALRKKIQEAGYVVEDGPEGVKVRLKE